MREEEHKELRKKYLCDVGEIEYRMMVKIGKNMERKNELVKIMVAVEQNSRL